MKTDPVHLYLNIFKLFEMIENTKVQTPQSVV